MRPMNEPPRRRKPRTSWWPLGWLVPTRRLPAAVIAGTSPMFTTAAAGDVPAARHARHRIATVRRSLRASARGCQWARTTWPRPRWDVGSGCPCTHLATGVNAVRGREPSRLARAQLVPSRRRWKLARTGRVSDAAERRRRSATWLRGHGGAGGDDCGYPPEPSGQHGQCGWGGVGLAGYGSGYCWCWFKLYDFSSTLGWRRYFDR